jgi:hypothetical protein
MIGKENVGKDRSLTCQIVVYGREGNESKYKMVVLAEQVKTINIPAPIEINDFKME